MKTTLEILKSENPGAFPCFKRLKNDGTIVLFFSPDIGVVVHKGTRQNYGVNYCYTGWQEFDDASVWEAVHAKVTFEG